MTNSESDSQLYTRLEELVSELKSELSFLVMGGLSRRDTSALLADRIIVWMSDARLAKTMDAQEQSTLRRTLLDLQLELEQVQTALRSIRHIARAMTVPNLSSMLESNESSTRTPIETPAELIYSDTQE